MKLKRRYNLGVGVYSFTLKNSITYHNLWLHELLRGRDNQFYIYEIQNKYLERKSTLKSLKLIVQIKVTTI